MGASNRLQQGFSTQWVRDAEAATGELLTSGELMQRAASGVSDVVRALAQEQGAERIAVLVGPGNNGGDALFAARNLAAVGLDVVVILGAPTAHEAGLAAVTEAGIPVFGPDTADDRSGADAMGDADIVVDGLLGIGAQPRPQSPWDSLVDAIGVAQTVVAVDCPTPGVRADVTVTFGVAKTSHLLNPDAVGRLHIVDIGLPAATSGEAESVVLSRRFLSWQWPVPGRTDHKYTRGVVGLATGSQRYPGAAVLGAVAAVTSGAGMVRYVGPPRPTNAVLAAAPEVVFGQGRVQAWVVGSGIDAQTEAASESERYLTARQAMEADVPVVIDAGALEWVPQLERTSRNDCVLTPHAGELAALLTQLDYDVTRAQIEHDPVRWAKQAADETGCTVLLKGGASVMASPEASEVVIENRAPAWLATAGTGDVLASLVGVALAAGIPALRACALAAYVHGEAARRANPDGPVRALDVATHLGVVIAELVRERDEFVASLRQPGQARTSASGAEWPAGQQVRD